MFELAVLLIIIGLALVILAAFVPVPAPLSQVGWALFAVGVILLLVALLVGSGGLELDHGR